MSICPDRTVWTIRLGESFEAKENVLGGTFTRQRGRSIMLTLNFQELASPPIGNSNARPTLPRSHGVWLTNWTKGKNPKPKVPASLTN